MEVQLIRTHRTSQTVAPLNGELRPLQLGLFPLGRLGVHLGPADGDAPALEPTDESWVICFAAALAHELPSFANLFGTALSSGG